MNQPLPTAGTPSPAPAGSPPSPTPDPAAGTPAPTPDPAAAAPNGQQQPNGAGVYGQQGDPPPASGFQWPDDWRQKMLTEADEAAKNIVARYQNPEALAKAHVELVKKFRSGETVKAEPPPEDPEQLKAWRASREIPEDPKGYELPTKLDDLDPDTREDLSILLEASHKGNLTKAQGKAIADALKTLGEKRLERDTARLAQMADQAQDALLAEWGPEFRKNVQMNIAYMKRRFGDDLGMELTHAVLPNGMRFGDHPEFSKFINELARADGLDILVGGNEGPSGGIDGRIAEIENIMKADMPRYYREGLNKEYGQLLAKREAREAKRGG